MTEERAELGGRAADGVADVGVGGDASEGAIDRVGDHALRGLAVVVGHVQAFCLSHSPTMSTEIFSTWTAWVTKV